MTDHISKGCLSTSSTTSGQVCFTSMVSSKSLSLRFWKFQKVTKLFKVSLPFLSTKTGRKVRIWSLSRSSTTKDWGHQLQKKRKIISRKLIRIRSSSSTTTTKMTRRLNLLLLKSLPINEKSGLSHMIQWQHLSIIQCCNSATLILSTKSLSSSLSLTVPARFQVCVTASNRVSAKLCFVVSRGSWHLK